MLQAVDNFSLKLFFGGHFTPSKKRRQASFLAKYLQFLQKFGGFSV
jgi:hypothetical protein